MSNRKLLKVINAKNKLNLLDQLRIEEILMRNSSGNYFILNSGLIETSVVLGISGKPLELIDVEKCKDANIKVIRRFSGGGTVIVDNSTIFSTFILNSEDICCKPYPREIMAWTELVYANVFNQLLSSDYKFSLKEHDYTINNLKFAGNAQCISKNRFVHHTSFLWDFCPIKMNFLKMPAKRPEYRQNRSHDNFLTKLRDHIPNQESFETNLVGYLGRSFQVSFIEVDQLLEEVDDIVRKKLTTFDSLHKTNFIDLHLIKS